MIDKTKINIQSSCRTLIDLFNQATGRTGLSQKLYLEIVRADLQEKLTFGQLRKKAYEFAAHLMQKEKIQPGDKVAVLSKNCADWDIAVWAIILAGAVPVLIDPERRIEGVKKHIIHTDSKLFIMAKDYQNLISREKLKLYMANRKITNIEMKISRLPGLDKACPKKLTGDTRNNIKGDDTAVVLCTSGTTGDPREVEITHNNLIANIQGALQTVKITAEDKLGHIIPPHHSFGFTVGKLIPLWVGATNIYTNRYRHIPELIKDKGITLFIGIPALFTALANKIEERLTRQKERSRLIRLADNYWPALVGRSIVTKMGWKKLRFFISGAAPLPKWVLRVFWRRNLQLREGYGTTENSPVYGFNANRKKLGSVGKPIPTLKVKIVDEHDRVLTTGEKGQIVLGGPSVVKGYYKNPKATSEIIKTDDNGTRWLYTGDLGYIDKDGYLFITGRKKHLIVLPGGKNVNPELVELALSQAKYVDELIVVPGYQKGPAEIKAEAVRAIVRPAWDQIEADTKLSRRHLLNQPDTLKNLLWQSINKCQQENQELAGFEKVQSKNLLEIQIKEFRKTTTGKIKRASYI